MLNPVSDSLIYQPKDSQDIRVSQAVQTKQSFEVVQNNFTIIGYPDDEGIKVNGGRIGSAAGPDTIRKYLYKMTLQKEVKITDVGNLSLDKPLEQRHKNAQSVIEVLLKNSNKCISFGGGHDYGFPDGNAFVKANKKNKPLVLNFDAHLDVRSTDFGISSGTPFYRLRNSSKDFDMIQIGIQPQCNSKKHTDWCKNNNISICTTDDLENSNLNLCEYIFEKYKSELSANRPCYISVDIDGFSSAIAPGCSQSWPTGFEAKEFLTLFSKLIKHLDVQILGVYEVAPKYDFEDITSKLAALIAYKYINS